MQKITPFLWFDNNVDEAIDFYSSVFPNTKVLHISRYGEAGPGVPGSILTATLQLEGQEFIALNGGPHYQFTEAVSFYIHCDSQEEVDYYWEALGNGGEPGPCGWLKDKFGLSWQVVPGRLPELLGDKNRQKADRVMKAMMKMKKITISDLEKAFEG